MLQSLMLNTHHGWGWYNILFIYRNFLRCKATWSRVFKLHCLTCHTKKTLFFQISSSCEQNMEPRQEMEFKIINTKINGWFIFTDFEESTQLEWVRYLWSYSFYCISKWLSHQWYSVVNSLLLNLTWPSPVQVSVQIIILQPVLTELYRTDLCLTFKHCRNRNPCVFFSWIWLNLSCCLWPWKRPNC